MTNYRKIYMIMQNAILDTESNSNNSVNIGFPTDARGKEALLNSLAPNYISTNALKNLLSVKGDIANTTIFNVSSYSDPNTVFLSCTNCNANRLTAKAPYGLKGGVFITVSRQVVIVTRPTVAISVVKNYVWTNPCYKMSFYECYIHHTEGNNG